MNRQADALAPLRTEAVAPGPAVHFDGRLGSYLSYALKHHPRLRAEFERWRAATERIAQQRRLPEPTLSYGAYLSRVETRVGPQRHRFSLSQAFPWPTKLTAGVAAASKAAHSAERRFEAVALTVAKGVTTTYWQLWALEKTRRVDREQLEILRGLFDAARVRLEVGKSSLAQLGQIQLAIARLRDKLAGLKEKERSLHAELVAAIGAPPLTPVVVADAAPALAKVDESEASLLRAIQNHPAVDALNLMAEARTHAAESAAAEGYPGFSVGLDYIETGPTSMPGVVDSGKDAVVLKFGVRLPLWWGAYGAKRDQARAESAMFKAERVAAIDRAAASLAKILAQLRDSLRRAKLYRHTLVPQAETVYGSVLGSYQVGNASLADVLLAQRDLLDLQSGLFNVQADHAVAWAKLEEVTGRHVRDQEVK